MSEQNDRDLSAAFDDLHAPLSTAGYADRVPAVEAVGRVTARRWPQALATALAVLLALAGAGTFLALRNARQGATGSVAGYPAARAGAAMAFDSTSGLTVMYGGTAASGSALADTWLWDGSSWAMSTGASPGTVAEPRMSDDPTDGGVLLTGVPEPAGLGGGGCVGAGSSGSATGTSTGQVAPGTPAAATGVPGAAPPAPPEPNGTPVASPPPLPTGAPGTACPAPVAPATLQTWLFTAKGWTHVASGKAVTASVDTPYPGSDLAYDPASGEVIAVSIGIIPVCGPPLRSGGTVEPDLICPLGASAGANSATSAPAQPCSPTVCSTMPCRVTDTATGACAPFPVGTATWTWSHGQWTERKGALIPSATSAALFGDLTTQHATLVTETAVATDCPVGKTCPAVGSPTAVFTWAGSAWNLLASAAPAPSGLSLAGATVAAVNGHAVALTAFGQLFTWSTSDPRWTKQAASTQPDGRGGAAMAEGPGGTLVLFGGVSIGVAQGSSEVIGAGQAPGADTWTWNGSRWQHVAGTAPGPVVVPTPCADDVTGLSNSCVPPAPVPLPAVTPSGSIPRPSDPIGA